VTYEFNGNVAYCKACYQKKFMSAGRSAIAVKLKRRSPKKSARLSQVRRVIIVEYSLNYRHCIVVSVGCGRSSSWLCD
jgi:hypothetical protein